MKNLLKVSMLFIVIAISMQGVKAQSEIIILQVNITNNSNLMNPEVDLLHSTWNTYQPIQHMLSFHDDDTELVPNLTYHTAWVTFKGCSDVDFTEQWSHMIGGTKVINVTIPASCGVDNELQP